MCKIIIKNLDDRSIETYEGSNTVLEVFQENFLDWMHACGAKGRCTTCKMIIITGEENLSAPTAHEQRFNQLGALKRNERLACQAILLKNELLIKVPESSKLPHLRYTPDP